jgi:hypothetical protein
MMSIRNERSMKSLTPFFRNDEGHPEQIELDIVAKNDKVTVVEIKSAFDRANVYIFARKVEFYTQRTRRTVERELIVTPYAANRAKEIGMQPHHGVML